MRLAHLVLFAAATIASLSAGAAPQSNEGIVEVRPARVSKVYLEPEMKARMQSTYRLDDGRMLRVTGNARKLFADLGDGKTEIVHVGGHRFEALGQDFHLRFADDNYADTVVVGSAASSRVASAQR